MSVTNILSSRNPIDWYQATPKDIEELVSLGQELKTCPYFASRRAIPAAQIVSLPYNLLLQKAAREATGIDLKDQVIIIDEAHNLIDTLLSIHSVSLSLSTIRDSLEQLRGYHARFKARLKGRHLLQLRFLINVVAALEKFCLAQLAAAQPGSGEQSKMWTVRDVEAALGRGADGVNMLEINAYLRTSKLARKAASYVDKQKRKEQGGAGPARTVSPSLHAIEGLPCDTQRRVGGRPHLCPRTSTEAEWAGGLGGPQVPAAQPVTAVPGDRRGGPVCHSGRRDDVSRASCCVDVPRVADQSLPPTDLGIRTAAPSVSPRVRTRIVHLRARHPAGEPQRRRSVQRTGRTRADVQL